MYNGAGWTDAEKEIILANPAMSAPRLMALLPSRSTQAIGNMKRQLLGHKSEVPVDEPMVRPAGDYVETLSHYLVDEWECLAIWLKWNGYHTYRELCRDPRGWVTILCTAK
jgi:hypothetical protein